MATLTLKQIQVRASTLRRVVTDTKNRVDVLKSTVGDLKALHLLQTTLDALKIAEKQLLELEYIMG